MTTSRSALAHQFDDLTQQHEAGALGMWIFLATELMVFGALFTGYAVYRTQYAAEFEAGSRQLNVFLAGVNTVVLLTSSLTMALAVHAAQTGRQRRLVQCVAWTAALGTTFLIIKALEYREDYARNLVPGLAFDPTEWRAGSLNSKHVELFLVFYYLMTGLHALHLSAGIVVMLLIAVLAWRGRYSSEHYTPVEVAGLYWHFVDVLWIFLLPLLYLAGVRSL